MREKPVRMKTRKGVRSDITLAAAVMLIRMRADCNTRDALRKLTDSDRTKPIDAGQGRILFLLED